jgi:uncharacterized protein
MKVVLDTNVLMSGLFFTGTPWRILSAWRDGKFEMAVSPDVLDEYQRVARELGRDCPGIDVSALLDLIFRKAVLVQAPSLPKQVCADGDDDRFIACAVAAEAAVVVSGDKLLLNVANYRQVRIMTPRAFYDEHLR